MINCKYRWFFGKLEHDRAKELLMWPENSTSSYLVCENTSQPGTFTLFIRNNDKVVTYPIEKQKGGGFFVTPKCIFSSIHDLVEYHCQQLYPCIVPTHHNEIDRKKIKLLKKLSSGRFSDVWQGLLKAKTVAVKASLASPQESPFHNFLHEAYIMQKFVHGNIVSLLGVCNEQNPHYIVMEFMAHGNLYEYLNGSIGKTLQQPQLIKMAAQVASGMLQLELCNCIHRDLAARNILVGQNLICKVGNFHFAQADNLGPNIHIKPAIKWTAPEALLMAKFSIKSDIWSFGIVLFEIITLGQVPYPDMTEDDVKYRVVHEGYRMSRPQDCPEKLYYIMQQCWKNDPINRLTFETLQWQLEDFYTFRNDYLHCYDTVI